MFGSANLTGAIGVSDLVPHDIAQGKSYSFTANDPQHPNFNFPSFEDTANTELTDGNLAASPNDYMDSAYAGYDGWKDTTTTTFQMEFDSVMAIQAVKSDFYPKTAFCRNRAGIIGAVYGLAHDNR